MATKSFCYGSWCGCVGVEAFITNGYKKLDPEGEMVLKAALKSADPHMAVFMGGWRMLTGTPGKTKDGQHTSPSLTMFEIDLSIWQHDIKVSE